MFFIYIIISIKIKFSKKKTFIKKQCYTINMNKQANIWPINLQLLYSLIKQYEWKKKKKLTSATILKLLIHFDPVWFGRSFFECLVLQLAYYVFKLAKVIQLQIMMVTYLYLWLIFSGKVRCIYSNLFLYNWWSLFILCSYLMIGNDGPICSL